MKPTTEQLADFTGLSLRMWNYFKNGQRNLSYFAAQHIEKETGIAQKFIIEGPRANVVAEIVSKFKLFNGGK